MTTNDKPNQVGDLFTRLLWAVSDPLGLRRWAVLAVTAAFAISAQAAVSATEAWVHRYGGQGSRNDSPGAVAVDGAGNVIVTGSSYGTSSSPDFATIKYSSAGVPLWTNRYHGFNDFAIAVAVDGDDNVVVSGLFATIKYLPSGTALWTNVSVLNGGNLQAMAVDGSGNVVVTGYSRSATNDDCYTAKYAAADGALLWEKYYIGAGNDLDRFYAVAIDLSDNVVVTGNSWSGSNDDCHTVKYAAADGALLWDAVYNPENGFDRGLAVVVDSSGDVVVAGQSSTNGGSGCYAAKYSGANGTLLWDQRFTAGPSGVPHGVAVGDTGDVFILSDEYSASGADYVTFAYSSAGTPLWTNRYNGPASSTDTASSVAVDAGGNVLVTGHSSGSGTSSDFATIAYSNVGVPLWTNRYNGPANGDDLYPRMAVDSGGNVIVAGYSSGSGSAVDYATIKYSNAGLPVWTNRYDGPGYYQAAANALVVDANGNAFVTGISLNKSYATIGYSSAGVPLWTNEYRPPESFVAAANPLALDGNGNVIVAGGSTGYRTIKYSNSGVPLWTNLYNGGGNGFSGSASPKAVGVDGNGNVFVTGYTVSPSDYATIKYSGAGVPMWTNRYNGRLNGDDLAWAMAIDGSGNVIVTGQSSSDYATIKYSNSGVPLWTNRYNGPGNGIDTALAVAVDGSGSVIVTGESSGIGSSLDYATIKYSSAGVPLWTNRYNGGLDTGSDSAKAVAVDGSGNVFVTGRAIGSGLNSDFTTIAYTSAGVPIWTNRYDGPGSSGDSAEAVVVDANGNVIVTGSSVGPGGDLDYATIAYSGAGVLLWIKRYNGPANGNDSPRSKQSLALGPDGSVYVTGSSASDRGGATDFATVKYMIVPQPTLAIQMVSTDAVRICWPTNTVNYVIESRDALSTNVVWMPVNVLFGIEGSNFCFTNTTHSDNARFFRLRLDN